MKYTVKRLMALLLALLLAVPVFAEESEGGMSALGNDLPADPIDVGDSVPDLEDAPMVGEAGELPQLDLSDALSGELLTEDAPQAAPDAVVTYCFMANDVQVAMQEAREGDAIERPVDPAAPEGYAFAGWFLEDGAPLFVDADGDGAIDPVIAHPDPLCPQIVVTARFEAVETSQSVPSEGEQAPSEGEDVEALAEEEAEESTEGENDQPTEGDDAQKPSPATEGSVSGEGGPAARPGRMRSFPPR